jgi:tRNA(Ile2) C34 agmatinyltransferase TiaS
MDPVLAGLNEHQVEEKVDGIQYYLANKANKARFNNVVKHQRLQREKDNRIQQKVKETQRAPPMTLEEIEKDPDLGFDTRVAEPSFEFVQEVEPLFVEKPVGKYEPSAANLDRMRAKKQSTDNRLVKKKFKAEPLSQTEIRDC